MYILYYNGLKGKKIHLSHVLLGNLAEIHEFHALRLLPAFQDAYPSPAAISGVFIDFCEEFDVYSIYCQNSAKSEELRQAVGVDCPFLKQCQKALNHALPLSAFLLKPIQDLAHKNNIF